MHTQKAPVLFVAVCLGFIGRRVWMISAAGGDGRLDTSPH